jgi:acyl carrier protein
MAEAGMEPSFEERIRRAVAGAAGVRVEKVTLKTRFVQDLNLDSLDLDEAYLAIEEEFQTTFSDEEWPPGAPVYTVGDALAIVRRHFHPAIE